MLVHDCSGVVDRWLTGQRASTQSLKTRPVNLGYIGPQHLGVLDK